jgi:hypothetical protein
VKIQNAPTFDWKSVRLEDTMKRDRENGSKVSADKEVFHISSSYHFGTRTIPGNTEYEDNIEDVWSRGSYPAAGDAVVDLRREGWQGVKRTSIGFGAGVVAGSVIGALINPSSAALVAGAAIGGLAGAGIAFNKSDGFLGAFREDFRCKNPVQAFSLANQVEQLAQQVAADKA